MKLLKKGALVGILTASFILTGLPQSTEAQNTYLVNNPVNVYLTAGDALNMENPIKSYSAGTYFIYKTKDGMINMSPYANGAGGWINPNEANGTYGNNEDTDNEEKEETTKAETKANKVEKTNTTEAKNSDDFQVIVLSKETNKYLDSYSAADSKETNLTYAPGTYYVYKTFNGMYNISKVAGQPGGWVNLNGKVSEPVTTTKAVTVPTKQKTIPTVTKTTQAKTNSAPSKTNSNEVATLKIEKTIYTYSNSLDAIKKENPKGTYAPGTYYIYKSFNGMYNISSQKGQIGAWINPASVVGSAVTKPAPSTTTTTKPTTKPTTNTGSIAIGSTYNVNYFTPVYGTSQKALNRVGAHEGYSKGTYYITAIENGMIRLATTKTGKGLWLNPQQNVASGTPNSGESITDKALKLVGDNGYDYYTWYGYNYREEWCAMFVSWLGNQTGNAGIIPTFDYVDDFVDYYKDRNAVTVARNFKPQKDMLVMFDYNRNGYSDHIGMVTGADDKYVYTVEGNYRDRVSEAKYEIDDLDILGYALPAYPGASVAGQLIKNGAFFTKSR